MDKLLRAEIVAECKRSMAEAMEIYQERWLTGKELSEYISIMTPRWLQDHGELLPRSPVGWEDKNGVYHVSSWLYPLHKIQAMFADGRIKNLKPHIE